jgi:predicted signal transduction protein with EAL and GGDEF domain
VQEVRRFIKRLPNILSITQFAVMIQEKEIKIKLSVGVAVAPEDSEDSEVLLRYSDIAMYTAKRDKDTNCKFFDMRMLKRGSDV